MGAWLAPLLVTLALQVTSAFLSRLIPFLAPILTAEAGIPQETVGYFAALNTVGSIAFLIAGAPLIRRAGPVRALQIGVAAGGAGALLILWPTGLLLCVASLLVGLGYGPSPAAGSEILQRHAPARRRALIFSIKQAGVPIGGMLGGLVLPLIAAGDWRRAIYGSAALALLAALAVQPLRDSIDAARDKTQELSLRAFLAFGNLAAPLRALTSLPGLPAFTAASFCFAVAQGVFLSFYVTFLVAEVGLSLAQAGALFAVNQAMSVAGRVIMGWLVDRAGTTAAPLCLLSVASAATTAALALTAIDWPAWAHFAVAAVAGVSILSWNGVMLAEVARLAPPARIAEASAGATLLTFVGYVAGPAGFAALAQISGGYRLGFAVVILISLAALAFLVPLARRR